MVPCRVSQREVKTLRWCEGKCWRLGRSHEDGLHCHPQSYFKLFLAREKGNAPGNSTLGLWFAVNSPTPFARKKSEMLFLDLFEEKPIVVLLASNEDFFNAWPIRSGTSLTDGVYRGLSGMLPTECQSTCLCNSDKMTICFCTPGERISFFLPHCKSLNLWQYLSGWIFLIPHSPFHCGWLSLVMILFHNFLSGLTSLPDVT